MYANVAGKLSSVKAQRMFDKDVIDKLRSRRSFVALVADRNRMAVMPSVLCSESMNSCRFKNNFKDIHDMLILTILVTK